MRDERIAREWFGAVRDAADRAVKALEERQSINPHQHRMADILFRQLLSNEMTERFPEAEGMDDAQSETLRRMVYSELIEDALAGTGMGSDDMALAVFLSACSEGAWSEEFYLKRFRDVLGRGVIPDDGIAELAGETRMIAERQLEAFAKHRQERRAPKPIRYVDGPPEGMDEFEYIDWQISH